MLSLSFSTIPSITYVAPVMGTDSGHLMWSMVLLVPGCLGKSGPTAEHTQCHLLLKSWFMIIRMLCLPLPGLCPGDGGVVTGCLV